MVVSSGVSVLAESACVVSASGRDPVSVDVERVVDVDSSPKADSASWTEAPPQAATMTTRANRANRERRTDDTVEHPRFNKGKCERKECGVPLEQRYTSRPVPETTLYFAYASLLDPELIGRVAPGAKFLFTAHYPETKMDFVPSREVVALPTLVKESGHTVWGGVFEIPADQVNALIAAEEAEGRVPGFDEKAVDREGNKYDCLAFVAPGETNGDHRPSPEYLAAMIRGAKHWSLPAGWVMGLEDLGEDPLFS